LTEQQWLKIYRETVHPLYGYMAQRTGGDRALTEDVVQESYLRALDHWNRKALPDSPIAWLKRVARNILIDYLRQSRRDKQEELSSGTESNDPISEDRLRSREIFLAINSLNRIKAKVLEAFYYEGMTIKEIADEMSLSERAVEGQLRRARRSLSSLLPEFRTNGGKNE